MNILHISNSDSGGAANAMNNLHRSLQSDGISSKVLVLYKYKNDKSVYSFLQSRNGFEPVFDSFSYRIFDFKRKLNNIRFGTDSSFTYYSGPYNLINHPLYNWADIIHLHWYHNFIKLDRLVLKGKKPIVFTLHDENLFLGGFHYSYDKDLAEEKAKKLDNILFEKKMRLLGAKQSLHFVAPSFWLFNILKEKDFKNTFHIPYSIDPSYRAVKNNDVRLKYGISEHSRIYLLLADHLGSSRKGINAAIKAFVKTNDPKSILIIVGNNKNEIEHEQILYLGYINGVEALSELYSMADVFVNPTLADNLPNTVLESLACGTPVIGFDTGGMKDMVNDKNGILLMPRDFDGLFDNSVFDRILALDSTTIANNCIIKFGIKKQLNGYKKVYEQLIP